MIRAVLLALVVMAGWPGVSAAEVYRYTDVRGNSYYVEGIDNVPAEYRSRAVPLGLPGQAPTPSVTPVSSPPSDEPSAPPPLAAPKGAGRTAITFAPGQRIVVEAKINGQASAQLLVDTGAARTTISPRALMASGIELPDAEQGGSVGDVFVESLAVGEARAGRMAVTPSDARGDTDGVLGRDFLDQFTVDVDASKGVLTLAPK